MRQLAASSRWERWVLATYRPVGHAQRSGPPLIVWLLFTVAAIPLVTISGRINPSGWTAWLELLSEVLFLPFQFLRLNEGLGAELSKLPAVPVVALRVALTVPFVFTVLAIRHFVRASRSRPSGCRRQDHRPDPLYFPMTTDARDEPVAEPPAKLWSTTATGSRPSLPGTDRRMAPPRSPRTAGLAPLPRDDLPGHLPRWTGGPEPASHQAPQHRPASTQAAPPSQPAHAPLPRARPARPPPGACRRGPGPPG